jgi:hypothetical protein
MLVIVLRLQDVPLAGTREGRFQRQRMIFGSDGELNLWTVRDRSWNTWLMARLRMRASAACQTCLWYGFTSFLRVVRVHDVPSRLVESSRTIWVCLQYIPFFNVVLNPCLLYYSSLLSQLRSPTNPMRLIALITVALAVSASALPRIVFERDLGNNARRGSDSDLDPQTSLSKCNESSLPSPRLHLPSSIATTGHFYQL